MGTSDREVRRTSAWIGFGLLLGAAILLVAATFLPLWEPLLVAAVLASATYGLYRRLERRFRGRKHAAAGVMTIALIVVVLIPVSIVTTIAIREGIEATRYVRDALREGGVDELAARLPDRLERPLRRLLDRLDIETEDLSSKATAGSGAAAARIAGGLVTGVSRILFNLVMLLIAYFAFLSDGHRLILWLEDVSPMRGRQTRELLADFRKVSRAVINSTVITSAAQSVVAGIGYVIAGIPNPLFFAVLTFFMSFIPSVGTGIVAVPLAALLLLFGKIWQGIFLAVWAVLVVGLVDNLLKPILIRGGMQIHGVVVFFSLIGGIAAFGPTGLIMGPLVVTFLLTMIRFAYRDFSPHEAAAEPRPPEAVPVPAKPEDVPKDG
jgi:predicted PurR-regulated permease PerM